MRPSASTAASIVDSAAGRGGRGGQVLEPVFDPFHRRAGLARRQAHQHHVREHRLLDAEAAAGVARRCGAAAGCRAPCSAIAITVCSENGPMKLDSDVVALVVRTGTRRPPRRIRSACRSCAGSAP